MKKLFKKYGIFTPFLFDYLIVILFLLFPDKYFFHLDMEQNLPTIYQGLKLFLVGGLSIANLYIMHISNGLNKEKKLIYSLLSFGFIMLAIDEIGQIHDNIHIQMENLIPKALITSQSIYSQGYDSSPWLLYYIPIFVIGLIFFGYMARAFWKERNKYLWMLFVGVACFLGTLILEFISSKSQNLWSTNYLTMITIEESCEMIGASFFMLFMFKSINPNHKKLLSMIKNEK